MHYRSVLNLGSVHTRRHLWVIDRAHAWGYRIPARYAGSHRPSGGMRDDEPFGAAVPNSDECDNGCPTLAEPALCGAKRPRRQGGAVFLILTCGLQRRRSRARAVHCDSISTTPGRQQAIRIPPDNYGITPRFLGRAPVRFVVPYSFFRLPVSTLQDRVLGRTMRSVSRLQKIAGPG